MTTPTTESNSIIVSARRPNIVRRFFRTLGPGVITGAADDDPSGIATYSIAGAPTAYLKSWLQNRGA